MALMPLVFVIQPASAADNNTVSDITVTITEQNPVPNIYHTDDYDNTLQAAASGTPTPEAECKIISGPDYTWSSVSLPYTMPTSGASVDLHSAAPAKLGWTAGTNADETVTVTASWTDDSGNTYTTKPTSDTPKFFALCPANVLAVLVAYPKSYEVGPSQPSPHNLTFWGANDNFLMAVFDNDFPANLYGRGELNESLRNPQYNPLYKQDLLDSGAPGTPQGGSINGTGATGDNNSWDNGKWKNPPPSDTGDVLWFQLTQFLDVREDWARGPTITSVDSFSLYITEHGTTRSGVQKDGGTYSE